MAQPNLEADIRRILKGLKEEINSVHAPVGREYSNDQFKGYMLATVKQLKGDVEEIKVLQKDANKDFRNELKILNDFKARAGVYILLGSTLVALAVTVALKVFLG